MTAPSPEVEALRRRYEATPREIDDNLHGLARGDRGCLGDGLAGAGALLTAIFGVIASTGAGGWGYMGIGALLLLTGFALSTSHQARSAAIRHRALTEGTLVAARILRADPALTEPGLGCAPAIALFSLAAEESARFAHAPLDAAAEALQAGDLDRLVDSSKEPLIPLRAELSGADDLSLAEIIVDKERLPEHRLSPGATLVLIVDPRVGFVEHLG